MSKPERIEQEQQLPNFFTGTSFSVIQIEEDVGKLQERTRFLTTAHDAQSATSMKLAAENLAKLAGQIQSQADHLAGVCVRHINRRPRV